MQIKIFIFKNPNFMAHSFIFHHISFQLQPKIEALILRMIVNCIFKTIGMTNLKDSMLLNI